MVILDHTMKSLNFVYTLWRFHSPLHSDAEGAKETHALHLLLENIHQARQVLGELCLHGSLVAHEHTVPQPAADLPCSRTIKMPSREGKQVLRA